MLTCLIDSSMQNMADADESLRAFFDGCLEYPELCSLANATGDPVTSDDLLAELNTVLEELSPSLSRVIQDSAPMRPSRQKYYRNSMRPSTFENSLHHSLRYLHEISAPVTTYKSDLQRTKTAKQNSRTLQLLPSQCLRFFVAIPTAASRR